MTHDVDFILKNANIGAKTIVFNYKSVSQQKMNQRKVQNFSGSVLQHEELQFNISSHLKSSPWAQKITD